MLRKTPTLTRHVQCGVYTRRRMKKITRCGLIMILSSLLSLALLGFTVSVALGSLAEVGACMAEPTLLPSPPLPPVSPPHPPLAPNEHTAPLLIASFNPGFATGLDLSEFTRQLAMVLRLPRHSVQAEAMGRADAAAPQIRAELRVRYFASVPGVLTSLHSPELVARLAAGLNLQPGVLRLARVVESTWVVDAPPAPAPPLPQCPISCPDGWRGDSDCDDVCNSWECNWDDGDCLPGGEAGAGRGRRLLGFEMGFEMDMDGRGMKLLSNVVSEVIAPLTVTVGTGGGLLSSVGLLSGLLAITGAATQGARTLSASALLSILCALCGLLMAVGSGIVGGLLLGGGRFIVDVTSREFPRRAASCVEEWMEYSHGFGWAFVAHSLAAACASFAAVANTRACCKGVACLRQLDDARRASSSADAASPGAQPPASSDMSTLLGREASAADKKLKKKVSDLETEISSLRLLVHRVETPRSDRGSDRGSEEGEPRPAWGDEARASSSRAAALDGVKLMIEGALEKDRARSSRTGKQRQRERQASREEAAAQYYDDDPLL